MADTRAYYPIYSDAKGAQQDDLMFIPYTNSAEETRLHAFLWMVNINTNWAFLRQFNFDAKKDNDTNFTPKISNQQMPLELMSMSMVLPTDGNDKSAQKSYSTSQTDGWCIL